MPRAVEEPNKFDPELQPIFAQSITFSSRFHGIQIWVSHPRQYQTSGVLKTYLSDMVESPEAT
jgi:hypothetical protein